jgi:hypothetical protein
MDKRDNLDWWMVQLRFERAHALWLLAQNQKVCMYGCLTYKYVPSVGRVSIGVLR